MLKRTERMAATDPLQTFHQNDWVADALIQLPSTHLPDRG